MESVSQGRGAWFLLGLLVGIGPMLWEELMLVPNQGGGGPPAAERQAVEVRVRPCHCPGTVPASDSDVAANAPARVVAPPPCLPARAGGDQSPGPAAGEPPGLSFSTWRTKTALTLDSNLEAERSLRSICTNDWHKNAEYNVTSHMVRRSRTVVGNTDRLHRMLRRVQAGRCIRVMILGGSVSHGYNVGGYDKSWGTLLINWLNVAHPCSLGMSGEHEVLYRTVGGVGSIFAINNWDSLIRPGTQNVDMIVVEYAVNDGFISDTLNLAYEDMVFKQQWVTEALVRRCLRYRNGPGGSEPPAIVYMEAGFKGRDFLKSMEHSRGTDDFASSVPSSSHHAVLQYYQIPTVSFTDVVLPMVLGQRECPEIDPQWGCQIGNPFWSGNPFSFYIGNKTEPNGIFSDVCCHPRAPSHAFMAILMGFMLDEEASYMQSSGDAPLHDWQYERDASRDGEGSVAGTRLPALLKLTPNEDRWVIGTTALFTLSFADKSLLPTKDAYGVQPEAPAAATGWSLYADSKDKLGLIARSPWSHTSVRLALGADTKVARLTVGYLRSYDNVSAVAYWVNVKPGLESGEADEANPAKCDPAFAAGLDWLEPWGGHRETVFDAYQIPLDRVTAPVMYLHLCLAPFSMSKVPMNDADAGKFKLLSVMAFPVGTGKGGELLGRMASSPAAANENRTALLTPTNVKGHPKGQ